MSELEKYIPIVRFIANLLGENGEVVLHDVNNPENSILAIENNHISGRQVGGVLTDLVLKIIQDKGDLNHQDFISNYTVVTKDKKICQSSSFFIRNDDREIIGVLCVNYDVSNLLLTKKLIDSFIRVKVPKDIKQNLLGMADESTETQLINSIGGEIEILEHLSETSGDVVNLLITKVINGTTIPVERMSPEEKIEIVRELNDQGLFMFKGGVYELAKHLKVSEATVYRYLSKVKSEG